MIRFGKKPIVCEGNSMTYSRMDLEIERAAGYAMPIMKECNSGEWLKEVKRRVERIEALAKRNEPKVSPSLLQKLMDDTRRSMLAEARELVAASQILYGEIVNEQGAK